MRAALDLAQKLAALYEAKKWQALDQYVDDRIGVHLIRDVGLTFASSRYENFSDIVAKADPPVVEDPPYAACKVDEYEKRPSFWEHVNLLCGREHGRSVGVPRCAVVTAADAFAPRDGSERLAPPAGDARAWLLVSNMEFHVLLFADGSGLWHWAGVMSIGSCI